jgi:hypothetical protein
MLNFRVRDLYAMLAQLRAAGATIDRQETEEGVGRFAWSPTPKATLSSCGSPPQTSRWSPLTGIGDHGRTQSTRLVHSGRTADGGQLLKELADRLEAYLAEP